MKISVLASSSHGNASVVSAGRTVLLVDAGISARRIKQGIESCGLTLADISGICITHEHGDHIGGLGVLSGKVTAPLYCSRYLREDIRGVAPGLTITCIEPGVKVQIGEIQVRPISVSHDAIDPLGYIFEADGVRLGYVTDTGHVTRGMRVALQGLDAIYLESNYDLEMLHGSGRRPELIERIEGLWGHLSNAQACELIEQIDHPGLKHVILAHLSPECNTPECAGGAMQAVLNKLDHATTLHIARQADLLPWIEL